MILFLDNKEIPQSEVSGFNGVTLTLRDLDESGSPVKSYSGTLKLTGSAYELIKNKILNNPFTSPKFNVRARLFDDCCGFEIFEGLITQETVDWCEGECEVDVTIIEEVEPLDCFRSTLLYESDRVKLNTAKTNFKSQSHPRVGYCLEFRPSALQYLAYIYGGYIYLILFILQPIVLIISVIITVICAIPFVNCPPGLNNNQLFKSYKLFLKDLDDNIIGCNRKHPSPLLRNYIKNVCTICGLDFKSSILNDSSSPYYDTMYFNAQFEKGTRDQNVKLIDLNLVNVTGDQLMESLKTVFNAKWTIQGTTLIFERRDFFDLPDVFVDTSQLDEADLIEQCYSFSGDTPPSFLEFAYTQDAVDWVGFEAHGYYDEIVEWNDPYTSRQKGEKVVSPGFGHSRFRDDNIDKDVLSTGIIQIIPIFTSALKEADKNLLLNNGTAMQPKLLIWDGVNLNNAKVRNYKGQGLGGNNGYNYPYVCEDRGLGPAQYAGSKLNMTIAGNLYHNFWEIENPRLGLLRTRDFKLRIKYSCDILSAADPAKTVKLMFFGNQKSGSIDEIQINFDRKEMTINGKI